DRVSRALESLGYTEPDDALLKESLDSLHFRDKPNAPLTLDEFAVIVYNFETKRAIQLKAQFDAIDMDSSGAIDVGEFRRLLWDMGFSVSRMTVEEILGEVDKDLSGKVELREFEFALKLVYERFGFSLKEVKDIMEIFDKYDTDESGVMSPDELAGAMGWIGHPATIEQAKAVIERHVDTENYILSRPEFLRIMRCIVEEELEDSATSSARLTAIAQAAWTPQNSMGFCWIWGSQCRIPSWRMQ
ncbi:unnamed protein product, partial [Polarella glacialis]